ncbi:MAG: aminotransferase class I/II-fold pyridoxal phosphate-dependent enzyme, partial [Sulfitobacter sp.]
MMYSERFSNLPAHVWPRLRALLDGHEGGGTPIHMTIGEPKHAFPAWVTDEITKHAEGFNRYPPNDGSPELRAAIAAWIARRYGVEMDPETEVMALNGTREGLYNAVIALCPATKNGEKSAILMPNPFYQVYMIGAISGEAEPIMVPATAETGHLPDYASLPEDVLRRTTAAYLCSPANPQGVVASRDYWADLIALAEKYDFLIFA